jgi:hypothetical protein
MPDSDLSHNGEGGAANNFRVLSLFLVKTAYLETEVARLNSSRTINVVTNGVPGKNTSA